MKSRNLTRHVLLVLPTLLVAISAFAGNYRGEPDAEQRCEEARELELAPERESLIEKCIVTKKDVAYCENYYSDYGAGGRGAGGKYKTRKFNNIPACQKAQKNAQRNRVVEEGIIPGRDATDFTTRDTAPRSSNRDTDEGASGREGNVPSSR